ncbi:hypothetical protein [Nakamurella endophytica]|uniref:hypothetical protein n=1 Tax=Nakamurella endophytica TaxID=1748367 RepID=UPI00166E9997|nr:hypothetical protein [Nakamurella endophytica]
MLQAHAVRSATARSLLLHGHDRRPREAHRPLSALLAGTALAAVIVAAAVISSRVSMLLGR